MTATDPRAVDQDFRTLAEALENLKADYRIACRLLEKTTWERNTYFETICKYRAEKFQRKAA